MLRRIDGYQCSGFQVRTRTFQSSHDNLADSAGENILRSNLNNTGSISPL